MGKDLRKLTVELNSSLVSPGNPTITSTPIQALWH